MLLWHVKDCYNIEKAIVTHEATLIAVNVLVLQEALQQYDDWNSNKNNIKIVEVTKLARDLIKAKQNKKFNEA